MTGDARRLQSSTAISSALHAGVCALYLLLKTAAGQNQVVITRVEFLDLHPAPAPQAPAGPAQRAPRGIADFLRMAIPRLKPGEPREAQSQEPRTAQTASRPEYLPAKPIKLDNRALARGGSIRLRPEAPPTPASVLSEAGSAVRAASTELSAPNEATAPAIALEAAGRKAARAGGGPSIRLDGAAPSRGAASMADIAAPAPGGAAGRLAETGSSRGISLNAGAGTNRGAKLPSLPVGYGGGGGGISLSDRPSARGGGALPIQTPAAAQAASATLRSQPEKGRNKSIEISGPLARRKIVSFFPPSYPDWAKAQGIEAEVVIRFFVSPDGRVRERMILERTSGFKQLDDLCMESLKKWVFVALNEEADQWGVVAFRFRLK